MADNISQDQLQQVIAKVNRELNVNINAEDFKSASYSVSSLKDILVQKTADELNGAWTTDMAFHKLRAAISQVKGMPPSSITDETELDQLFPASGRKAQVAKLNDAMGIQPDILKPNGVLYGILIVIFFACIPFSFAFDWFIGGIVMVVSGILIYAVSKTGNNFKVKTVGHLADHLAWRNYLKQKRDYVPVSEEEIRRKVEGLI